MVRNLQTASHVRSGLAIAAFLLVGITPLVSGSATCVAAPQAGETPPHNIAIRLTPKGFDATPPVVTAIAIDPRGRFLAASGDDHVIRVLDVQSFRTLRELTLHVDWVQALEFSPDGGSLVSVANDGQIIRWMRDEDWAAKVVMRDLPALRSIRFTPNGEMIAAVGFSPQIFLRGLDSNIQPTLNCGCRDLRTLAFRGDGLMIAAAGRSGDVHFFDAVTGSSMGEVTLHRRRIHHVEFIGQSNLIVTASEDGHAIVYDVESKQVIHDLTAPGCKLFAACMIGVTHLAIGGSDNNIRIYDLDSGVQVDELLGHRGSIATLKSSGRTLYSGSYDTTLRRWNLNGLIDNESVAGGENADLPFVRTSRLP
jgi:WD40 repeat protein